jgi:hypothetical protein
VFTKKRRQINARELVAMALMLFAGMVANFIHPVLALLVVGAALVLLIWSRR